MTEEEWQSIFRRRMRTKQGFINYCETYQIKKKKKTILEPLTIKLCKVARTSDYSVKGKVKAHTSQRPKQPELIPVSVA